MTASKMQSTAADLGHSAASMLFNSLSPIRTLALLLTLHIEHLCFLPTCFCSVKLCRTCDLNALWIVYGFCNIPNLKFVLTEEISEIYKTAMLLPSSIMSLVASKKQQAMHKASVHCETGQPLASEGIGLSQTYHPERFFAAPSGSLGQFQA